MSELEVELKLEAAPADLDRLAAAMEEAGVRLESRELRATYFDTPDRALRRAGLSLRIRRSGDRRVQTVKASGAGAGALLARPEWECAVDGDDPVLDDRAGPLASLLPDPAALRPAFSVAVTRRVGEVAVGGGRVEAVIDRGTVSADGRAAEIAEAELELKDGSPAALFALARTLAKAAPVRLGVLTKSERGYRLLDGSDEKPAKAERGVVADAASAGDGFAAVAAACIRQFRLNEDLLVQTRDPDALHQARVALRRLRSALSIFRRIVADNRFEHLRGELRWLAATLGEARDLDVLLARSGEHDALREARERAYATVLDALASPRVRELMLDLAEWIAMGAWRTAPADPALVEQPAQTFAAHALDRLRRRLKKRGKHLARLDDEERHQVRIVAKKLRYAAEFFADLFLKPKAQRRARRFIEAMEALQEQLGGLNDLATAPAVLARLGLPAPDEPKGDRERLIGAAAAAYHELIDRKRFWR